ncbi:hypothetical protein EIN_326350 [Entamoeba invadens IP1]|uniref:Uncharacterized protein n=1 Tax=Entamoeba invadens IP1 TaxID=370355 RepID=L7FLJ2_ENTIV|nr:hypothetical protein EIN_326350 [Entamoeba invadens IP1]ELP87564.1 hypothetical protein EIN_326350 [Entamoeba invadens IP1]|eukprot:XP_004254335.1 hypothetical protein EIN_326350 [Entamoeba invadens IP1]
MVEYKSTMDQTYIYCGLDSVSRAIYMTYECNAQYFNRTLNSNTVYTEIIADKVYGTLERNVSCRRPQQCHMFHMKSIILVTKTTLRVILHTRNLSCTSLQMNCFFKRDYNALNPIHRQSLFEINNILKSCFLNEIDFITTERSDCNVMMSGPTQIPLCIRIRDYFKGIDVEQIIVTAPVIDYSYPIHRLFNCKKENVIYVIPAESYKNKKMYQFIGRTENKMVSSTSPIAYHYKTVRVYLKNTTILVLMSSNISRSGLGTYTLRQLNHEYALVLSQ